MITVIVIDDNRDTVDVFSEYLETKDVNVVGKGYDGKEAVNLYVKLKPDVIFLDVMMDRFDGLYALEEIKKMDSDAKVIMVTADLTQETHDRLMSLGANMILHKPFEIEEILMALNRITQLEVVN